MYAQVLDGRVNLVGGAEMGLPLPEWFLEVNPHVLNIDISAMESPPEVGDYYVEGVFLSPGEYEAQYG